MNQTSTGLLSRARKKDQEAWIKLVNQYSPTVYAQCRNRGLSPDDAKDIVQQVFLLVYRNIADFSSRETAGFRRWLATITRNAIFNFFRKNKGQANAIGGSSANNMFASFPDPLQNDSNSSVQPMMIPLDSQRKLDQALSGFRPKTREVFQKLIFDEKSIEEVAKELGMKPGAVRQAKHKVLKKLREEFGAN